MSTALSTHNQPANTMLVGDAFTNPAYYEHVKNLAGVLANAAFTPKHLIAPNNPGRTVANCTRVVIQALRWGFDIFAVADETYEVRGRFGYQGKLIIAVVNARAGLKGRLKFTYAGKGPQLTITVSGQFADEEEPCTVTLSVEQGKTANEMWIKDPEQKLAYSGAIKWARRHCPQLVMGVRTVEDLEQMNDSEPQNFRITAMDDITAKLEAGAATLTPENSEELHDVPEANFGNTPDVSNDEADNGGWLAEFAQCESRIELNKIRDRYFAADESLKDDPDFGMCYEEHFKRIKSGDGKAGK